MEAGRIGATLEWVREKLDAGIGRKLTVIESGHCLIHSCSYCKMSQLFSVERGVGS